MKTKILFLCVFALNFLGSHADTKNLIPCDEDNLNQQFRLVNYATGDGIHATQTWIGRDLKAVLDADGANFSFISAGTTGDYYIYNVNEDKYLYYTDTNEGGGNIFMSSSNKSRFKITLGLCTAARTWYTEDKSGYVIQPYSGDQVIDTYLNLYSNGLGFYAGGNTGNKGFKDAGSVWSLQPIKSSFMKYQYTYNDEVWFEEKKVHYIGETSPEFTTPYGVTVNIPRFTVNQCGNIFVPVSYEKGERGFDFSEDFSSAKWSTWSKRYSYQNRESSQFCYNAPGESIASRINSETQYGDNYLWAAIGNPYSFIIVNKGAGEDYVLSNPSDAIRDGDKPVMNLKSDDNKGQSYMLSNQKNSSNVWGDYSFIVFGAQQRTALNGNGDLMYWVDTKSYSDDGSRMKFITVPSSILTGVSSIQNSNTSDDISFDLQGRVAKHSYNREIKVINQQKRL